MIQPLNTIASVAQVEPDQLRQAMCDWIAECDQFEYEDDEDEAREGNSDNSLISWIGKNYDGGMAAFIQESI